MSRLLKAAHAAASFLVGYAAGLTVAYGLPIMVQLGAVLVALAFAVGMNVIGD